MNTVIIEDELSAQKLLEELLTIHCPSVKVLAKADSVLTGISAIKQYQPDLIFLDAMIKGGTSFDLLEKMPELDSEIIFITSHEKFAIQAFKISAVDYLLKPIDPEELTLAIEKVRRKLKKEDSSNHIKLLLSNYKGQQINGEIKIALPTSKGLSFVRPDQIIRCESDNTYTTFYLVDQRSIIVSKTLKACMSMLEPFAFFRVHNRSLINLKFIEEYERGEGGHIRMIDGSEVAVSRRRKESFLKYFKAYTP